VSEFVGHKVCHDKFWSFYGQSFQVIKLTI